MNAVATPQTIRTTIPIASIKLSQTESQIQRRKRFVKAEIDELAKSIKSNGLINPILVRRKPGVDVAYELVAGERRYLAAKQVTEEIDATVRELTDEQVLEIQLIENLQRVDVHPLQEAEGYEQLMKKHGHKAEELGDKVGKSEAYIYARLKLLALCKEARAAFYDGKLNASTALLVARIPVESLQREALKDIIDPRDPMSAREVADYVQREFMLRLSDAPFPTDVDNFVPGARKCGECPKNTICQPQLFGDVKGGSAGVCTDTTCFKAKISRAIEIKIEKAKETGQRVIDGAAQVKKIFPYGLHSARGGFTKLDDEVYAGGSFRKVSTLVGKDAKTTLVLAKDQSEGGRATLVEVVDQQTLQATMKAKGIKDRPTSSGRSPDQTAREKKAKQETEFRRQLYLKVLEKVPQKLTRADLEQVAIAYFDDIWHDARVKIIAAWEWAEKGSKQTHDEIAKARIPKLTDVELSRFLFGLVFSRELHVSPYDTGGARVLFAAARRFKLQPERLKRDFVAAAAAAAAAKAKKTAKGKKPSPAKASAKKKAARKAK